MFDNIKEAYNMFKKPKEENDEFTENMSKDIKELKEKYQEAVTDEEVKKELNKNKPRYKLSIHLYDGSEYGYEHKDDSRYLRHIQIWFLRKESDIYNIKYVDHGIRSEMTINRKDIKSMHFIDKRKI